MKRRSFIQGLIKAAAIIALAPQIAFQKPAEKFGIHELETKLEEAKIHQRCYGCKDEIDFLTDRITAEKIRDAVISFYKTNYG